MHSYTIEVITLIKDVLLSNQQGKSEVYEEGRDKKIDLLWKKEFKVSFLFLGGQLMLTELLDLIYGLISKKTVSVYLHLQESEKDIRDMTYKRDGLKILELCSLIHPSQ